MLICSPDPQTDPSSMSERLAAVLDPPDAEMVTDPSKRAAFLRSVPVRVLFAKMMSALQDKVTCPAGLAGLVWRLLSIFF